MIGSTGCGTRVTCCEIEPAVFGASSEFARVNHTPEKNPNFTIVFDDGRSHLQGTRETYDLIISDMRMPDGDGPDFYKQVLASAPALARRFVFITGDTANPEAWAFLEDSGVPVIEKPFPAAVFEDAVVRVMTTPL